MKIKKLGSLPLGTALLAIAILIERLLPANDGLDFISGLLIGLSLVLNISYLIRRSRSLIRT